MLFRCLHGSQTSGNVVTLSQCLHGSQTSENVVMLSQFLHGSQTSESVVMLSQCLHGSQISESVVMLSQCSRCSEMVGWRKFCDKFALIERADSVSDHFRIGIHDDVGCLRCQVQFLQVVPRRFLFHRSRYRDDIRSAAFVGVVASGVEVWEKCFPRKLTNYSCIMFRLFLNFFYVLFRDFTSQKTNLHT